MREKRAVPVLFRHLETKWQIVNGFHVRIILEPNFVHFKLNNKNKTLDYMYQWETDIDSTIQ